MTQDMELIPATVPEARQAGAIHDRWPWTKPWIWTDRMLTALESGVKGGKWFSLIDKVFAERTLYHAARHVTANSKKAAGTDHVTPAHFADKLMDHVHRLSVELRTETYRPRAIRRCWIPKPGSREKRPLGIPTVRDRAMQAALRDVIEPIFEWDFAEHSYGFRPRRGCKDALRRVDQLLKAGYTTIVDVDLKSYFDTIPHDQLLIRIRQKISDGRVLALIEAFLEQGVMEGLAEWTPEEGCPQGAVISPLLSNIYLDPLDQLMATGGYEMVRYADDFVILCRSREEANAALTVVRQWTTEAGLTLHPTKTKVVDVDHGGFDFLGYHFKGGNRFPREKSLQKLKDAIRAKTHRANGHSLPTIIQKINDTLRGWFVYFQHITKRYVYTTLDRWIRGRLRSILRKRQKRRGHARGHDHQRWPNAFFAEHGLFNLTTAYDKVRQPSSR